MHKRDEQSESAAHSESSEPLVELSAKALRSAAVSEQIVKRATRGLIRVESRRRARMLLRRVFTLAVIAGFGYAFWRLFGDRLPYEWLNSIWDDLVSKIEPVLYENADP